MPRIDVDMREVAAGCRAAGLDLLEGARRGWTKADLAAWLVGPYRTLTRLHLSDAEEAWADVTEGSGIRTSVVPIGGDMIGRLLRRAHHEVLQELGRFAGGGDPMGFAFRARARGTVIRCVDASGRIGFVPVAARPGSARLGERALSLFATDFLLRPRSYRDSCTVCCKCGVVVFDPRARSSLECGVHVEPASNPAFAPMFAHDDDDRAVSERPSDPEMRPREKSGVEIKGERDTWREFPAVEVPPPPKLPRVG